MIKQKIALFIRPQKKQQMKVILMIYLNHSMVQLHETYQKTWKRFRLNY